MSSLAWTLLRKPVVVASASTGKVMNDAVLFYSNPAFAHPQKKAYFIRAHDFKVRFDVNLYKLS